MYTKYVRIRVFLDTVLRRFVVRYIWLSLKEEVAGALTASTIIYLWKRKSRVRLQLVL